MKVEGVGWLSGWTTRVLIPIVVLSQATLDEMSKAGVEKGEKLLTNPKVSLVIVNSTIPVGGAPRID